MVLFVAYLSKQIDVNY